VHGGDADCRGTIQTDCRGGEVARSVCHAPLLAGGPVHQMDRITSYINVNCETTNPEFQTNDRLERLKFKFHEFDYSIENRPPMDTDDDHGVQYCSSNSNYVVTRSIR